MMEQLYFAHILNREKIKIDPHELIKGKKYLEHGWNIDPDVFINKAFQE